MTLGRRQYQEQLTSVTRSVPRGEKDLVKTCRTEPRDNLGGPLDSGSALEDQADPLRRALLARAAVIRLGR
jgi:hypothetical protein